MADIKLTGFDSRTALARLAGNRKLYETLLERFYQHYGNCVAEGNNLLENARWSDLERYAHTIKGLAASMGENELSKAAATLEHKASLLAAKEHTEASLEAVERAAGFIKEGSASEKTEVADIQKSFITFASAIERALGVLRVAFTPKDKLTTPEKKVTPPAVLDATAKRNFADQLTQLWELLESYDADSAQLFADISHILQDLDSISYEKMRIAVLDFDYDEAREYIPLFRDKI